MKSMRVLSLLLILPFDLTIDETYENSQDIVPSEYYSHDEFYRTYQKYFGDIKLHDYENPDEYWKVLRMRIEDLKTAGIIKPTSTRLIPAEEIGFFLVIILLIGTGYYIAK